MLQYEWLSRSRPHHKRRLCGLLFVCRVKLLGRQLPTERDRRGCIARQPSSEVGSMTSLTVCWKPVELRREGGNIWCTVQPAEKSSSWQNYITDLARNITIKICDPHCTSIKFPSSISRSIYHSGAGSAHNFLITSLNSLMPQDGEWEIPHSVDLAPLLGSQGYLLGIFQQLLRPYLVLACIGKCPLRDGEHALPSSFASVMQSRQERGHP